MDKLLVKWAPADLSVDELVQKGRNSIANALELRRFALTHRCDIITHLFCYSASTGVVLLDHMESLQCGVRRGIQITIKVNFLDKIG